MAPQTHNCILLPNPQHHQQQEEEEDSLSLSDFPTVNDPTTPSQVGQHHPPQQQQQQQEEFEFLAGDTATQGSTDMCTADEVFLNGQLLPLKASVRSESLEGSSSSSLTCSSMSRSHSTDSSASAGSESRRRLSVSSNFHAHPSPKPGVISAKKSGNVATTRSRRRSASGLFGVAMAPEIELEDLRLRTTRRRSSGEIKKQPAEKKVGKLWLLGQRFTCACRVGEVMEPTTRKTEEEKEGGTGVRSASSSSCRSSRTFLWLEDLNSAKDPVS